MSVNKPHLRVFKFPAGALGTFAIVVGLYYLSHGVPGVFSVSGVSLPFEGLPRTLVAILFYSIVLTHVYEAYLAYSLASDHRASTTNTVSTHIILLKFRCRCSLTHIPFRTHSTIATVYRFHIYLRISGAQ